MIETSIPRREDPAKAGAPSEAAEPTAQAVVTILGSRPVTLDSAAIDPEVRRQMIAAEAYAIAERRGFAAGRELDDWVAAETAVDALLRQGLPG